MNRTLIRASRLRKSALLILVVALFIAGASEGMEVRIHEVIDGDTVRLEFKAFPLPLLRIEGVDTPELRGKCEKEKKAARAATEATRRWLEGQDVVAINTRPGKYFGRYIGDLQRPDGSLLSDYLLDNGFARAYLGGRREGWCD